MPVILAIQEAEIRKIAVRSQPRQIVQENLSQKTHHKTRAGGVAQSVGSEFKSQYCKKTKKQQQKKSKLPIPFFRKTQGRSLYSVLRCVTGTQAFLQAMAGTSTHENFLHAGFMQVGNTPPP
jgi:hypothetical protein